MMDLQRNRKAFEELCLFYRVDLPKISMADGDGTECRAVELATQQALPTVDDFWAGQVSSQTGGKVTTHTRAEPVSVDDFWNAMLPNKHSVEDEKATLSVPDRESEPKRQRLAPAPEKQEQDPPPPPNAEEATTDDDDETRTSERPRRSARASGRAGVKKRKWWKATDTPEKPPSSA